MPIKSAAELSALTRAILLAAGADKRNADRMAEALVASNLCGVDTHGVFHLPGYVEHIREGYIRPAARPAIIRETPTSALITGNWTFGHVAAKYAAEVTIEKARTQNIAVAGIVEAHHIGRLGEYVELAAAHGMIGMIWAGGQSEETPHAVPYGGRQRVLHTNPLAVGFPAGEDPPIMFDFSTTALSGVKVIFAHEHNESLPAGSIVDKEGRPTNDPADFFAGGGHLPFGGHKGYALMVAVELLSRVMTGADALADPARGGPFMRHQGVTMLMLRADLFQPLADFTARAGELADRLRAVPAAPGFSEVLVPGDPEQRIRAHRQRDGIPVAEDIWQSLVDVATSLGVPVP